MKRILSATLALFLVGASFAQQDPESVAKALHDSANKIVQVMADIKDKAGAEKAKPQLVKLFEETTKLEKEFRTIPDEAKKKLEEIWRRKFEELRVSFNKEGERLRKDEAIYKVLADVGPFKALGEAKTARARVQAEQIATALQAYKIAKGNYPAALDDLEKGDKPYIEKGNLKDPWGKTFQYDAEGPKNKGLRPDVWTVDPTGKTIGNWTDRPAPPKDK